MNVNLKVTCVECHGEMEFVDAPKYQRAGDASDHRGHAHVRCPKCSPKWWCACLTISIDPTPSGTAPADFAPLDGRDVTPAKGAGR